MIVPTNMSSAQIVLRTSRHVVVARHALPAVEFWLWQSILAAGENERLPGAGAGPGRFPAGLRSPTSVGRRSQKIRGVWDNPRELIISARAPSLKASRGEARAARGSPPPPFHLQMISTLWHTLSFFLSFFLLSFNRLHMSTPIKRST